MNTTIERALVAGDKAKKKLYEIMEKSQKTMHTTKATVETLGACFGQGVLAGRYGTNGELSVMGVPVDLASGLVLHGLGFSGLLGAEYEDDLHNLGNGSLAYYTARMGVGIGQTLLAHESGTASAAAPASLPAKPATSGLPVGGYVAMGAHGGPMTPAEMAAFARAA